MFQKAAFLLNFLICTALIIPSQSLQTQQVEPDLELKLVIELTRHGERASKTIYEGLFADQGFGVASKQLT